MAGLPVDLLIALLLVLVPPDWTDYAAARDKEKESPVEAVQTYTRLQFSKEEAATLALYRLIQLGGADRAAHFQLLLTKNPPQPLVEAAFKDLLDAGDPKALDLYPRCVNRLSQAFRRKAEKTLLKIRWQNKPGERPRVIQEVFGGKSAYARVLVGQLCLEAGRRLDPKQWMEVFRSCLQARDLDTAGACLPLITASRPKGLDYLMGRYYFLKRDYAAAVDRFKKDGKGDGEEDHPYQEGRCWLMLRDYAKAKEAFGRVTGNLLPLGRLSILRVQLMEGDAEAALLTARTIPISRAKRDAQLSCAIALAHRGEKARALEILKGLKADPEVFYWKSRWEGKEGPDLSPQGAPYNYFQTAGLAAPVASAAVAMPDASTPHTFAEFLLGREMYEDARFYLDRLDLSPLQRAYVLSRVREHRNEVSAIYPEASRMLNGPGKAWDARVLDRFFPRAFESAVLKACSENGVPPEVVWSIMRQESVFRPDALSPAGAMGLMQLIPPTWAQNSGPDENPWDAEQNIASGVRYLKKLYAQLGDWAYVAAAYNAGEDAVETWIRIPAAADGPAFFSLIPFSETKAYVRSVLYNMLMYRILYAPPAKE